MSAADIAGCVVRGVLLFYLFFWAACIGGAAATWAIETIEKRRKK